MFNRHTVDQCCRHSFFNIMAGRRNLRQRVIALIENGFSASDAVRRCHVPPRTAQMWAHKFQSYWEFQRRYSTRRPRCWTRADDEVVRRVHEDNSFRSANQIRAAANFPGTFYEPFERCKYSLPESCVQRGLNRGTSRRHPSLRNRLEGFRLGKRNLHRRNIHLFRL